MKQYFDPNYYFYLFLGGADELIQLLLFMDLVHV
jgi:hypothetical protein